MLENVLKSKNLFFLSSTNMYKTIPIFLRNRKEAKRICQMKKDLIKGYQYIVKTFRLDKDSIAKVLLQPQNTQMTFKVSIQT